MGFNGDWFRNKLTEKQKSQRALARHLELDPAAITLMFRGERRMQLEEARSIAAFLQEPVEAVLRAAGLPLRGGIALAKHGLVPIHADEDDVKTTRELIKKYNDLLAQAEKIAKAIAVLKS